MYTQCDAPDLEISILQDYCLALSLQSLKAFAPYADHLFRSGCWVGPGSKRRTERNEVAP
jgi:hypothetical protein